jgi:DNA polymerase-3 subunit beta
MNLSLKREDLLGALQKVVNVVERRQAFPILANVLFEVNEGVLFLTTTDTEIELTAQINEVACDGAFVTTLPARKLLDIIKSLPEGLMVALDLDADKVTLKAGKSRFKLACLAASDFPRMNQAIEGKSVSLVQKDLHQLIQTVAYSMAVQDVRYYLNGILFELEGKTVRCVATDGHRLALAEREVETSFGELLQAILPKKAVQEMLRMISASDETITLKLADNFISMRVGEVSFLSKLIEGRFPAYRRVIPTNNDRTLVADRLGLKQALSRVAILSNEKAKGVRLNIKPGQLTLSAQNPEHEESEEVLSVEYLEDEMEIGFNVTYLIDSLDAQETQEVRIELLNAGASALMKSEIEGIKSSHVIMPMKL